MLKKIKKIHKRIKLFWKILKIADYDHAVILTDYDLYALKIRNVLQKHWELKGVEAETLFGGVVDELVASLLSSKPKEEVENINEIIGNQFKGLYWEYTQVAGYVALWELKIKMFSESLGVETRKTYDDRSKKQKKTKMLPFKDFSVIIKELNERTNYNLELDLNNLKELRDAVTHGNLDQLRLLYNNCSEKFSDASKGNVHVLSITNGRMKNLSDPISLGEKEAFNSFTWFLEVGNSKLLNKVWTLFASSVGKIHLLQNFLSSSYDERSDAFTRVVINGENFTEKDKENFEKHFIQFGIPLSVDDYFNDIKKLIKRPKKGRRFPKDY